MSYLFLKWMKFVLLILRDNLLHLNHVDILDNSEFRRLVRMSRFLCERNTLVSSARIIHSCILHVLYIHVSYSANYQTLQRNQKQFRVGDRYSKQRKTTKYM